MAVLLYQIGIFIAIQIAAMFGKNSRNTAVVLISIFTILQVFISWLLILQIITIIISYNISNNLFFKQSLDLRKDRIGKSLTRSIINHDEQFYKEKELEKKEQEEIFFQRVKDDPELIKRLRESLEDIEDDGEYRWYQRNFDKNKK